MKRLISMMAMGVALVMLTSCEKQITADNLAGTWNPEKIEMNGNMMTLSEFEAFARESGNALMMEVYETFAASRYTFTTDFKGTGKIGGSTFTFQWGKVSGSENSVAILPDSEYQPYSLTYKGDRVIDAATLSEYEAYAFKMYFKK